VAVNLLPPDSLPSTLSALKSDIASVVSFTRLLSSLDQKHCFRVKKGGPGSGGLVAFFLLGELHGEGWGGLVGIGVWGDEW
jgi:hypothetical protein